MAQMLDLLPASSAMDPILAEMSNAQAGLEKALVPYTGPPKAAGSTSALAIMDVSPGLDLPPTSSAADLNLADG